MTRVQWTLVPPNGFATDGASRSCERSRIAQRSKCRLPKQYGPKAALAHPCAHGISASLHVNRGARWLWVLSPKRKYLVVRGRNPVSYTVGGADTHTRNYIVIPNACFSRASNSSRVKCCCWVPGCSILMAPISAATRPVVSHGRSCMSPYSRPAR